MKKAKDLYQFLEEGHLPFDGAHDVFTRQWVVEHMIKRIDLTGTFLVMLNVEFVISLVYTYNIAPENITFYSDHDNKSEICSKLGVKYITNLETDMKFDVVIGNPPYKQGLWRVLMQQALDLSKKYVVMVSPDGTIQTSTKYADMKTMLEAGGIQSVTPCQADFEAEGVNVVTSSEICYYVFDKTKAANQAVFNKLLTKEEQLTLSIKN